MVSRGMSVESSAGGSDSSMYENFSQRFMSLEEKMDSGHDDQTMDSKYDDSLGGMHRKQREFIPDNRKDDSYWDRRRRNNEAAKRSREKRRINDIILEQRVMELTKENHLLRAQLGAIRDKYGISGESLVSMEQLIASMPTPDQVINLTRPSSRTRNYISPLLIEAPSRQSVVVARVPNEQAHTQPEEYQSARYTENHTFQSPSKTDCCSSGDEASPSPQPHENYISSGMPFKMRHKNQQMGEKEAANTLLSLTGVKEEAMNLKTWPADRNRESPSQSGSTSDSGVSSNDWSSDGGSQAKRPRLEAPNQGEGALRAQLARLASEVESLKSILKHDRYSGK